MVTTNFTGEALKLSNNGAANLEIFPSSDYFGAFNQKRDHILSHESRSHKGIKEAVIDVTPSTVWNIHNRHISGDKVLIEVSIPCGSQLMVAFDGALYYLINDIEAGDIIMRNSDTKKAAFF